MKFNYALKAGDYTIKNALLWGICYKHFEKAMVGHFCNRVVHVLIGIAELLPIIGQICSIFEMAIVTLFGDLSRQKESFDQFKKRVASQLPQTIKLQEKHPIYKRPKLQLSTVKSVNPPTKLNQPPQRIKLYSKEATFYGYNAEGIRDYGWGCAWRAIQTCLSSYHIKTSFSSLFHTFGPLQNLRRIYKDKYPKEDLASSRTFAPYDLGNGWAEPFIGEMVMHCYGISADLVSVNGIPGNCHAPYSVFHEGPIPFMTFKERLETHFKRDNPAPVMIDDGTYTSNVIGIGSDETSTTLWISDPHINEGVNQNNGTNGLYTITLNKEGEQIACSLDNEDQHQKPNLFNAGSYLGLSFHTKNWMVLFPT